MNLGDEEAWRSGSRRRRIEVFVEPLALDGTVRARLYDHAQAHRGAAATPPCDAADGPAAVLVLDSGG